ncbi:GNAT family N-acetyltransferase [[Erwinia] mediterraneensis]|uniref:GNAT family N-acetyltransferase n=1 Tax=[Erwinia] mediterraneensis TaxID=2161819 RepID=UPI003F6EC423
MNASQARQALPELCEVLRACVAEGASVGFVDADDSETLNAFWQSRIASIARKETQLLVAREAGVVVATVMTGYSGMPNGRHRAEISKLLVHPQARRQGIARRLMQQAEALALARGCLLLVLDTRSGDVASQLYLSLGWQVAGTIPFYAASGSGQLEATTLMYKKVGWLADRE